MSSLSQRAGGPTEAVVKMSEAVAAKGHEVSVFSPNRSAHGSWIPGHGSEGTVTPPGRPDIQGGVRIERFAVRWPARFGYSPDMAAALRRRVRDFDVAHLHALYLHPTIAAGRICSAAGIPYLVEPHGALDPWHQRHHRFRKRVYETLFERSLLNRAAGIHYATAEEMDLARPVGIRAPGIVVPLGVDIVEYSRLPSKGAFRARHPRLADSRLILFLGRITPKKGLDLLVRSFAQVHEAEPNAHLVIAGPDDEGYGPRVRSEVAAHRLEPFVTFTGIVLGAQKLELLADADVWVLPSYAENFGLAALEALCCGLPTVLSDRVNIHKEVAGAGAGLVTPCDANAIAEAILRILREPDFAAGLGERARALAATYSWDRTADLLIASYQRMAAGLSLAPEPWSRLLDGQTLFPD